MITQEPIYTPDSIKCTSHGISSAKKVEAKKSLKLVKSRKHREWMLRHGDAIEIIAVITAISVCLAVGNAYGVFA